MSRLTLNIWIAIAEYVVALFAIMVGTVALWNGVYDKATCHFVVGLIFDRWADGRVEMEDSK